MDVKCPGCFNITTVFSHAQYDWPVAFFVSSWLICLYLLFSFLSFRTAVTCASCNSVLCQPTGGKARLTEGCAFRRKAD
jgi:small subunit ribosomal protein S27e